MDRVFIITGLRLQALRMVNAQDFIYSKGYLGLLSTLGATLGITFCCAPGSPRVYKELREKFRRRTLRTVHIDGNHAIANSETLHEDSFSIIQEHDDSQINPASAPWDRIYEIYYAWYWCRSNYKPWWAVRADEENFSAGSESLDETLLPTTEGNAFQTHSRSARHSMDDCATSAKSPPHGGLQRHHTF